MSHRFRTSNKYISKFTKDLLTEFEDTFAIVCNEHSLMPVEKIPLALQALGLEISRSYYDEVITNLDFIDFDKFLTIIEISMQSEYHLGWMQDELQEMFDVFDKDKSGDLDATELKRVFVKIGEILTDKEMDDQVKDFDVDHDGTIGVGEFDMMVKSTRAVDFIFDS